MEEFIALPWPNIAGFMTCISLLLFAFGPKIPFIVKFFSSSVQEMVGVAGLRADMLAMHQENSKKLEDIEDKIDKHEKNQEIHRGLT